MTYDPEHYWNDVRGPGYEREAIRAGWVDVENEPVLALLETLRFDSVLEVGCGFGRVGRALLRRWPGIRYTGLDVSSDLVQAAQRRLPGQELIHADVAKWTSDRQWDLVLAVSVLGHLLPTDIEAVVGKLRRWARLDLVTVDWNEVGGRTAYQFGHDYRALYGPDASEELYGRQTIWHVSR